MLKNVTECQLFLQGFACYPMHYWACQNQMTQERSFIFSILFFSFSAPPPTTTNQKVMYKLSELFRHPPINLSSFILLKTVATLRRRKKNQVHRLARSTGRTAWLEEGNALLVKVSTGVKKATKMSKVDLCFSSNKLTK